MKNKFTIIRNAVIGVLAATSLVSCDDILDAKSPSIIGGNSFWKTEEDIKSATQAIYTYLREADEQLFLLGESRAETAGLNASGSGGGYEIYYNNTLTPATVGANWHTFYQMINFCNLMIKYGEGVEFASEADKNYYMAQAYITRAWAHFTVTRGWGDAIIRTEPVEGNAPSVIYKKRSPQSEVMEQIKSDVNKAIELFGDHVNSGAAASGRIYWNKPAALALKADVYLWSAKVLGGGDADLRTALEATEEVSRLANDDYIELTKDYKSIFAYNNKFNGELLFCLNYQKGERESNFYIHCWIIQAGVPSNIDEETRNTIFPTGGGQALTCPSEILVNAFDEDDTRKDGTVYDIYTINDDGDREYYQSLVTKGSGLVENGNRYFMNHVILYRYADVILMRAEAKNALGMDPTEEINMIRQRAYGDKYEDHVFVKGSQEYNDEVILEERLKEFAFECKRWFDLRRFGKEFDLVPSLKGKSSYMSLFPISLDLLSQEPYVEQNPGWSN